MTMNKTLSDLIASLTIHAPLRHRNLALFPLTTPTSQLEIYTCKATCDTFRADASGKVVVALGCPTVKAPNIPLK